MLSVKPGTKIGVKFPPDKISPLILNGKTIPCSGEIMAVNVYIVDDDVLKITGMLLHNPTMIRGSKKGDIVTVPMEWVVRNPWSAKAKETILEKIFRWIITRRMKKTFPEEC